MMVLASRTPWWDGAIRVKDKGYSQGERQPALLRQCFCRYRGAPVPVSFPIFSALHKWVRRYPRRPFCCSHEMCKKLLSRFQRDLHFSKMGVSLQVGRNAPSFVYRGIIKRAVPSNLSALLPSRALNSFWFEQIHILIKLPV